MKEAVKTPVKETLKTTMIVLICVIVLAGCLYAAIKLMIDNETNTEAEADNLIVRAVDGDTLEMGSGEIIRLICVDTPEEGEAGYEESKAFLYSWISKENISIERVGLDNYNRSLAWVYSSDVLVNKEIVDSGFGEVFEYKGDCERVK